MSERLPVAAENEVPRGHGFEHVSHQHPYLQEEPLRFGAWLERHKGLEHATRVLAIVSGLAGTPRTQADTADLSIAPPGSVEPITLEMAADGNAVGLLAHIEEAFVTKDPEAIKSAIATLHVCPECIPDEEARIAYTYDLFGTLRAADLIMVAPFIDLIPEPELRHTLLYDALNTLAENPATYKFLAERFETYTQHIGDVALEHLFSTRFAQHPLEFANAFADNAVMQEIVRRDHPLLEMDPALLQASTSTLSGSLDTLTAFYGHEFTARYLSSAQQNDRNALFTLRTEVEEQFSAEEREALLTNQLLASDPFTLLELVRDTPSDSERADEQHTHPTTLERITDAIKHYAYPQITLRKADRIRELLASNPALHDEIVRTSMERCTDENNYQALLNYQHIYEETVSDKDLLDAAYGYAAFAAYRRGDFYPFLSLHRSLSEAAQATLAAEYAEVQYATEIKLSTEGQARYGHELKLALPFSADHVPFNRGDMTHYLTEIRRDSVMATAQAANTIVFHDQLFEGMYGEVPWATPYEQFNTILYDAGFATALRDTSLTLSYANVFMLVESVYGNLKEREVAADEATIGPMAREILTNLERVADVQILGPGTLSVFGAHAEAAFDIEHLKKMHEIAGGEPGDMLYGAKGVELDGRDMARVKRELLSIISSVRDEPLTIILSGHGSPENWAFLANTPDDLDRSLAEEVQNISYIELAEAIRAAQNPQITLIVAACFSHDYVENLLHELQANEEAVPPLFSISEATEGNFAYYRNNAHLEAEDFQASTMLRAMVEVMKERGEGEGFRMQDLLEVQTRMGGGARTIYRLPSNPQSTSGADHDAETDTRPQLLEITQLAGRVSNAV